jgi:hypothetical protein
VVTVRGKAALGELMMLRFGFLNADDIRLHSGQPFEKTLACGGADAVYVDTDYPKQFNAPIL